MSRRTINLFMWGFQEHYTLLLELRVKDVFKQLGVDINPKVLLVGTLAVKSKNMHPICIEPENAEYSLKLFEGLLNKIETIVENHHLQDIFYSNDELGMREKPEVIMKDSIATAVRESLSTFDKDNNIRSFCNYAHRIDNYYIVPVIQIPESVFKQYTPLKEIETDDNDFHTFTGHRSFIHSCISTLLSEAIKELHYPNPGRSHLGKMRNADEIVRLAANAFMHTPGAAITKNYVHTDLLESFNLISSLLYEGIESNGQLILADSENKAIDFILRFKEPVKFRERRWVRKILQMATTDIALIANSDCIFGLGRLNADYDSSLQDVFIINFIDHYHWELQCDDQVMLRSHYGDPKLPQESISREHFISNYARLFTKSSYDDQKHIWKLFNIIINQKHGSMIVVATDAEAEAQRLKQQGTVIEPVLMTEELLSRVSDIDGTILIDPHCICYAIGVILDGTATNDCTPARGSRFNSGQRYVKADTASRLAIVISDDHTVDITPLLRLQIKSTDIELNISLLEKATLDNFHKPRSWIDDNRFYFNDEQCKRANLAIKRIDNLPRDDFEIHFTIQHLSPDPLMDDSYII